MLVLSFDLLVRHWCNHWDWLQYPSNPDHQDLKHQQKSDKKPFLKNVKRLLRIQTGSKKVFFLSNW